MALTQVTTGPYKEATDYTRTGRLQAGSVDCGNFKSLPEALLGGEADEASLHTPPLSPRCRPAPHRFSCSHDSPHRDSHTPVAPSKKRKPSEFDGKVQWEAYFAQFQLLADAQCWDKSESALQLVASLRGAALEVLGHLTSTQRMGYQSVVEALRRKFGNYQQAEVYRARLKGRVRMKGESLPQLAQDIDTLVRRAYPSAPEDMVGELTTEYFMDALQNRELQLYVKQAHPKNVKEALARALELEAFTRTSVGGWSASSPHSFPPRPFQARRARTANPAGSPNKKRKQPRSQSSSGRSSPVGFRGSCWGCGQVGHKRYQCRRGQRTRSLERPATTSFQPCCKSCGQYGHFSIACKSPGGKRSIAGWWGQQRVSDKVAPCNLSCRRTSAPTMKVQGFVDGQPCQMTIDTGAEGTFVRPDLVATRNLPEAKQQLCGVTGHCTSLRGPVEVRIGVGSSELLLPVYVADVEDSCLLGQDYLTQRGACVDLGRKLLRVGGEELPLLPGDAPAEVLAVNRVRLAPRSETRVPCMLSRKMVKSAGMVEVPEHLEVADGVAVARSMVKVHGHARRHLTISGHSMKARYDDQAREAVFKAGDTVWLHNPRRRKGFSPKLQSPWEGPYDVVEALSDVTYRIRRGTQRTKVVHVDRLWRYRGEGVFTWQGEDDDEIVSGSEAGDLQALPGPQPVGMDGVGAAAEGGESLSSSEELGVLLPAERAGGEEHASPLPGDHPERAGPYLGPTAETYYQDAEQDGQMTAGAAMTEGDVLASAQGVATTGGVQSGDFVPP